MKTDAIELRNRPREATMRTIDRCPTRAAIALVSLLALALPTAADASTIYVSNAGADSGACGSKTEPCRSITRGIANAEVGGTVIVGPGIYGDVDRDGTPGEAGEETAGVCDEYGNPCLLAIDKAVKVTSSGGAFATIISARSVTSVVATVGVSAAGATFGAVGKGFTVVPPGTSGVAVLDPTTATDVTIGGIIVHAEQVQNGIFAFGARSVITGSRVIGGDLAFLLGGASTTATGNVATNAQGGFLVHGSDVVIRGAVAEANAEGLRIDSVGTSVTKSSFIGNAWTGIVAMPGATGTITHSNVYGNGFAAPPSNCGFQAAGTTVTVTDSWWGAPTGPGADPADDACNEAAGATDPFATAPINVKVKPIR
jgi:hypothetical protein